jgi:hypothetical protein
MRPSVVAVAIAVLPLMAPRRLPAQDAAALLQAGVQAYRNLEFDRAAGYFQRALESSSIGLAERTSALAYLGATEIFRGQPDSGRAVFRTLVRVAPRYRIDRLVFPPEVTTSFEAARRATPVVAVALPDSTTFRAGESTLPVDLFASTYLQARVEVVRGDGTAVRGLYAGPVGDSLRTEWDGMTAAGSPVPPGRYVLLLTSTDSAGVTGRIVRVPLDIAITLPDTMPLPQAPPDSVLLPERTTAGPGLQALVGGLVLGTAVAVLPNAVAPDASGREIPENIAANERVRADWQARRDVAAGENAARLRRAWLSVRAGPPQIIEREGR